MDVGMGGDGFDIEVDVEGSFVMSVFGICCDSQKTQIRGRNQQLTRPRARIP